MKTMKLVVILLITAFMFNSCIEEEVQENTYLYGQVVYSQAAYTKLQIVTYVKDSYIEEYGEDYQVVQDLEQEEKKLIEFRERIANMERLIGVLPGVGPIDPDPIGPIPIPDPCDVSPDFNVLSDFDGLNSSEILNKIDQVAIELNCAPQRDLSNLAMITEGFTEVGSVIYNLEGTPITGIVNYNDEDAFGQAMIRYGDVGFSGEVIVINEVMVDRIVVKLSYSAFID